MTIRIARPSITHGSRPVLPPSSNVLFPGRLCEDGIRAKTDGRSVVIGDVHEMMV
jgi:hypothetical protein